MHGRRDATQHEARGGAPIQGSTLTDVLLQGGALGKITKALSPAKPASDPKKVGDGSTIAPPPKEATHGKAKGGSHGAAH